MICLPVFEKYEAVLQVACCPVVFGENKIRFRKDGERREDIFLSALASLQEKNHFTQSCKVAKGQCFSLRLGVFAREKIISRKDARPQRGGYAQISGIYPPIFPQLLT
ncbi:MAG: hypothetical protein ACOYOO_10620 [Saprospiraceae bacterium]